MIWLIMTKGVADLITIAIGTNVHTPVVLHHQYFSGKGTCHHRLTGVILNSTFPNYLCASGQYAYQLPDNLAVVLVGKSSTLGFHIDNYCEELTNKSLKGGFTLQPYSCR
ncbi:MAG: hypothetical protein WAX77_04250 [Methylococcaceae bacterium]